MLLYPGGQYMRVVPPLRSPAKPPGQWPHPAPYAGQRARRPAGQRLPSGHQARAACPYRTQAVNLNRSLRRPCQRRQGRAGTQSSARANRSASQAEPQARRPPPARHRPPGYNPAIRLLRPGAGGLNSATPAATLAAAPPAAHSPSQPKQMAKAKPPPASAAPAQAAEPPSPA